MLLSIQIKQAVLVGQRHLQHRSLVGALLLGPSDFRITRVWSPAHDVKRWVLLLCVCFPPEAVLNLAPPVAYFVYSSAAQLAFITLAHSCY